VVVCGGDDFFSSRPKSDYGKRDCRDDNGDDVVAAGGAPTQKERRFLESLNGICIVCKLVFYDTACTRITIQLFLREPEGEGAERIKQPRGRA
jgi:hypothetical protein